jgi:putative ABC transport system permease protein
MLKNIFTVALRNFLRQKLYSFINVIGLASGLTCTLFIYLWVNDEMNKDRFHRDSERIFRIVSNLTFNDGQILTWDITPGPLAEDIRDNQPQAEAVVRTQGTGSILFQYEDKNFMERGYFADAAFFELFSFPIVKGTPNKDPQDVSSISISETLAQKLFGNDDPIGKTVKLNKQKDYMVTAVFKDITGESSLKFDYILPFEVYKQNRGGGFNWGNYDHPLYVKLHDASQADEMIREINERRAKLRDGDGGNVAFYIQPFTEHYLYSQFENGVPVGGRIKYVQIFIVVAVFMLLIACINFMNMATARAASRAKEVGVRKVIGAQRKSLIFQFITESVLTSTLAMFLALAIAYLLLPLFNQLVQKQIILNLSDINFLLSVIGIILITGLLAGSYPAFFLSSYQPVQVLKGSTISMFSGTSLRKLLVVFQFSLTVVLIACSLVIYNQIDYIRNKNIGYDRQSILTFRARGELWREFEAFKNDALQYTGIRNIARANESLVQVHNQNSSVNWPGKPDNSEQFFRTVVADFNYLETMGLELLQGRFFAKEFNDTSNFVLTKRAVEVMGLTEPIGTTISQWGMSGKVVGVVNDFHSRSLHEAMDPIVFMCKPEWTGSFFVRFEGTKTQDVVAHLAKIYKKYNPEYPFDYTFLEDDFEKLYQTEKITGSLALGFTIMAIIISGLGLIGLAAYTTERKRKEISIRKTLGASVTTLITMMSRDFAKLSLVAAVIGCPVAYLLMQKFLESYAYHTALEWSIFIYTALAVLTLSLLTVIFQVAKAAVANPVDALRNE